MKRIIHKDIIQDTDSQYQKIGILTFAIGVILSAFGEFELIAIMFKLSPMTVLKFIPGHTALFSAIFYLILGNFIMLIEFQIRKRKQIMKIQKLDQHGAWVG